MKQDPTEKYKYQPTFNWDICTAHDIANMIEFNDDLAAMNSSKNIADNIRNIINKQEKECLRKSQAQN